MPYIFSFQDEAARRGFLGFEISDELAAKGLLEMFFYYYFEDDLRKLTHHTERALSLIRKMASDFSFLEIHDLYYEANFEDKKGFKDFLLKKLKEKGIKFPQSEQELDAFLGIGKK